MPNALRHVLLVGATGLVGREVHRLLANDESVARVTALVRRPLPVEQRHPKLVEAVVDFDALDGHSPPFAVDQVICALGTTIRQAGSQEAFRRVDHDYPLRIAHLARAHGARHFLLVSAVGADAASRVFYNRVKGEVERDLLALGYPSVTIARPSLLEGDRTEVRVGERIAAKLGFLVPGRWKPVHVRQVARALVQAAREDLTGVRVLENAALRRHPR
jgi:uncharacterized protein YbjT (DUF2867 family)